MQESIWNINGETLTEFELVRTLIKGDNSNIIAAFFYKTCYPLFASVYNKFYTDCESVTEFINEIYAYVLYEPKDQRTEDRRNCKLAKFGFRCNLTTWLKVIAENYCHYIFAKKTQKYYNFSSDSDRIETTEGSIESATQSLNMSDALVIIKSMPNERYRKLIQYRYLEEKTNEETASLLGMTMANYYNKHKLAKAQYCEALRKEGLL